MSSTSRPAVYSLLAVVFVLLLAMMAMLSINNQRHQRLADQTADLQRSVTRQANQINSLRGQLRDCDTMQNGMMTPDTSWNNLSGNDLRQVLSHR